MIDRLGQQHEPGERTRLYTQGHRIGDGGSCVLVVVYEAQAWSICVGLDPDVGVRRPVAGRATTVLPVAGRARH